MGCGNSRDVNKDTTDSVFESLQRNQSVDLNDFQYWYQVLDWLDFPELLSVSRTCHIFHDHSGYAKILKKFTVNPPKQNIMPEASVGAMEEDLVGKMFAIEIGEELGSQTPGFMTPKNVEVISSNTQPTSAWAQTTRTESDELNPQNTSNFTVMGSQVSMVDLGVDIENYQNTASASWSIRESAHFQNGEFQEPPPAQTESSQIFKIKLWQSLLTADMAWVKNTISKVSEPSMLNAKYLSFWNSEGERVHPLAIAVVTGNLKLVQLLLKKLKNIDINAGYNKMHHYMGAKSFLKLSPLQLACAQGFYKIAHCLLKNGADPDFSGVKTHKNRWKTWFEVQGAPPIIIALSDAYHGFKLDVYGLNFNVVEQIDPPSYSKTLNILLKFEANPNIPTHDEIFPTPIFYALQDSNLLKKLLKAGANPNETNSAGHTPLYKACELNDSTEIPSMLIQYEAQIDPETCRPMFAALTKRYIDLAQFLVEQGAKINGTQTNPSALQVAISLNDINICKMFINWEGAEIDWEFTQNGKNLFHRIAQNKGSEIFDFIMYQVKQEQVNLIGKLMKTEMVPGENHTTPEQMSLPDEDLTYKFQNFANYISI